MSNNRTCKVCGKSYHYCPTCPRDNDKPTWMTRFDSSNCKQLWDILAANGNGEATDAETVQKLNSINYKSIPVENEGIKAHIARLMGEKSAPLSKDEIREEVVKPATPVSKPVATPSLQEAMAEAADSMHKKNGFKFLNK